MHNCQSTTSWDSIKLDGWERSSWGRRSHHPQMRAQCSGGTQCLTSGSHRTPPFWRPRSQTSNAGNQLPLTYHVVWKLACTIWPMRTAWVWAPLLRKQARGICQPHSGRPVNDMQKSWNSMWWKRWGLERCQCMRLNTAQGTANWVKDAKPYLVHGWPWPQIRGAAGQMLALSCLRDALPGQSQLHQTTGLCRTSGWPSESAKLGLGLHPARLDELQGKHLARSWWLAFCQPAFTRSMAQVSMLKHEGLHFVWVHAKNL